MRRNVTPQGICGKCTSTNRNSRATQRGSTIPVAEDLLCPVRNCRQPLHRIEKQIVCVRRHSFDIARSGYINLLQPQDRRSKQPGDTANAVAARRRLHDRGFTAPLLSGIAEMVGATPADIILDAGCGEGFYAGSIAKMTGCATAGIDISTAALDAAARRYPECLWIAANADRFVPFAYASFTKILSITARMNALEFRRVLNRQGRLLVAIPSPDDLIELRGKGRDRVARTVDSFRSEFELIDTRRTTTMAALTAADVADVLHSVYRPMQTQAPTAMRLTFSLDLLLFRVCA